MQAEDELLGDFRPGFTLWRKAAAGRDVLVAQLEGGELCAEDVREGLSLLREAILESRRYVTLYDLSLQDFEAGKLLPHAPSLLSFAAQMRSASQSKQDFMMAVCADERTRNWIRWILGFLPQQVRYAIFKTPQEAWDFLASEEGVEATEGERRQSFDAYGEAFSVPRSLASFGDASPL
jgi:hypothetical protein